MSTRLPSPPYPILPSIRRRVSPRRRTDDQHWAVSTCTDFRHFQSLGIEPLFPFGAGLSYSTFEYANIAIKDWGVAKRHAEDQKNYRRNNDGEGDDEGQKGEIGRDVAEW